MKSHIMELLMKCHYYPLIWHISIYTFGTSITECLILKKFMSRVFKVTPKRVKRTNGTVLTPEMEVTVTTQTHTSDPFYNGAKELKEAYMRMYGFDYQKACCSKNDFDFKKLD